MFLNYFWFSWALPGLLRVCVCEVSFLVTYMYEKWQLADLSSVGCGAFPAPTRLPLGWEGCLAG